MTTMFPALKLKRGEVEALAQSERAVIDSITPLFDVVRPSAKTSIEKRIDDSIELIRRGWPKVSRPFFLDLRDLPLEARLPNGTHPVLGMAQRLALHGHKAIHCIGFDRDDAYQEAFINAVRQNTVYGVALRLDQQDMKLLETSEDLARALLSKIGFTFERITIFLDLGSIHRSTDDLVALVNRTQSLFQKLGTKNFIFLASSMWDHSLLKSNKVTQVPRTEIGLWEQLRLGGLLLGYGDYGVIAPTFVDPPKNVIPAPKLRYTTPTCWLVSKGEKPRKGEHSQYPRLARGITSSGKFRTNDLGWGSEQIQAFSTYERTTTDHSGAVAIDTCTHLDVTVRQIANVEQKVANPEAKNNIHI